VASVERPCDSSVERMLESLRTVRQHPCRTPGTRNAACGSVAIDGRAWLRQRTAQPRLGIRGYRNHFAPAEPSRQTVPSVGRLPASFRMSEIRRLQGCGLPAFCRVHMRDMKEITRARCLIRIWSEYAVLIAVGMCCVLAMFAAMVIVAKLIWTRF
jgi:hypothetical protein